MSAARMVLVVWYSMREHNWLLSNVCRINRYSSGYLVTVCHSCTASVKQGRAWEPDVFMVW